MSAIARPFHDRTRRAGRDAVATVRVARAPLGARSTCRDVVAIVAAALLAAAALAPFALHAQLTLPAGPGVVLAPGARVRVYLADDPRPIVARFVGALPDTLRLAPWTTDPTVRPFDVAMATVSRLQRYDEPRTRVLRNAGYGLAAGVLVGGFVGATAAASDDGAYLDVSPIAGAVVGGITMALPGAVVGAITGFAPTAQWTDVPLPRRASARTVRPLVGRTRVPVPGGPAASALTLGLSVRTR